MEFRDLKQQYQMHKKEIDEAIRGVLMRADFIQGQQVKQLETELAEYVGVKHCITCANGTDALQLALMTWGIGAGDAVFVPDFTFFSTAEAVAAVGATPIFVDIYTETFNISIESLECAIKRVIKETDLHSKAVIAVDLFGQPAEYGKIRKVTEKYGLLLLEDAAQGFGGSIDKKRACSFGDIAITSFFPAKPLGCYGDGGAVFTDNDEWAQLLRSFKIHGKGIDKYDNVRIGMNSRLDTLQAAVLLAKFPIFSQKEISTVNDVADYYNRNLQEIVVTPIVKEGYRSSWAQYTILLEDATQRMHVQNKLKENGIPSAIYYPKGMHEQSAMKSYKDYAEVCRNTEYVCDRCLSLPIHPYITEKEMYSVVSQIQSMKG